MILQTIPAVGRGGSLQRRCIGLLSLMKSAPIYQRRGVQTAETQEPFRTDV